MMRTHINIFRLCVLVGIGLLLLLIGLICLVTLEPVSKFICVHLKATPYELVDSVANYFSLAASVLLGIVVYYQAQKINNLEISQYEVFLGATGVNENYSMGDTFLLEETSPEANISIIQSFSNKRAGFLVNLNLYSDYAQKPLIIPLDFIVRSQPLVTGLHFKEITISILARGYNKITRTFKNTGEPIYELFEDNSNFIVAIATRVPHNFEIDEAEIQFNVNVFDQIGREHSKKINTNLKGFENTFCLYSSISK